jgi:hypothetical protein
MAVWTEPGRLFYSRAESMLNRSKTNARPGENLTLRNSYARAHVACELGWFLPKHFERHAAAETHHIFGGTSGRTDLVSNLIRVSWENHAWCHKFPADGRICCLFVKHEKGELDPAEFQAASGMMLPGWLLKVDRVRNEFVRPMLERLRRLYP